MYTVSRTITLDLCCYESHCTTDPFVEGPLHCRPINLLRRWICSQEIGKRDKKTSETEFSSSLSVCLSLSLALFMFSFLFVISSCCLFLFVSWGIFHRFFGAAFSQTDALFKSNLTAAFWVNLERKLAQGKVLFK